MNIYWGKIKNTLQLSDICRFYGYQVSGKIIKYVYGLCVKVEDYNVDPDFIYMEAKWGIEDLIF